jgi:hypothetical protein
MKRVSASYRISEFFGSVLNRRCWRRRRLLALAWQRLRKESIEREQPMRHGRCLPYANLLSGYFFVYATKLFETFG